MNLSNRLQAVVLEMTTEYRRFKQLENLTDVQADTWKSWFHGRQRPTAEMIEAAGKAWPEYAFWLTTGISDAAYGHVAPGENGYPKRSERKENTAALFRKLVDLQVCQFGRPNRPAGLRTVAKRQCRALPGTKQGIPNGAEASKRGNTTRERNVERDV